MNFGYWSLLILIFTIPAMAAGGTFMYLGIHDLRSKDPFGWVPLFAGWFIFWWATLYSAFFIIDNLTP